MEGFNALVVVILVDVNFISFEEGGIGVSATQTHLGGLLRVRYLT